LPPPMPGNPPLAILLPSFLRLKAHGYIIIQPFFNAPYIIHDFLRAVKRNFGQEKQPRCASGL